MLPLGVLGQGLLLLLLHLQVAKQQKLSGLSQSSGDGLSHPKAGVSRVDYHPRETNQHHIYRVCL